VTPPSKRLVIVLEDDPLVADALCLLLHDWGFECLHGAALGEILPQLAARAGEVRAIISDDHLRDGATGLDALRAAEAQGVAARSLLLTASLGRRIRAVGAAAGYPSMEKPVEPQKLRAWLASP
jgi:DNA-binding response OmpR family regulator